MKINEIFESVQGEGRAQGKPVMFIRLSGCTRKCDFCDTKYHDKYTEMETDEIIEKIKKSNKSIVVFTGGEPLLQFNDLQHIASENYGRDIQFHMETNGDLLKTEHDLQIVSNYFDYICISPKEVSVAKQIYKILSNAWCSLDIGHDIDIKVVTDLSKVNKNMVKYATMLMPLTKYDAVEDKKIRQRVWDYCSKIGLFYSARLHVEVWGATVKK